MSGFTNTAESIITYSTDVIGDLTSRTLLEHYDALVEEGRANNDDLAQRYTKFAEAEVELIYEQHLIRPLYNSGQKWEATVSKTIGFERPQASCSLSRYKLKGMWVLTDIVGTNLRNQCQAIYEAKKAALDPSYTIFSVHLLS